MKTTIIFLQLFFVALILCNCEQDKTVNEQNPFDITLKNTEDYTYDFQISGDEEGATIITQAEHAEISELIRGESTNWSVVYHYKPLSGYSGDDSVKIETCTGGDGTNCGETRQITIYFTITK